MTPSDPTDPATGRLLALVAAIVAVIGVALVGAWLAIGTRPEARLLAGYVAVYSAGVIAFFVFSRYRVHVVPALAALADGKVD